MKGHSSQYTVEICRAYLAKTCKSLGADYQQIISKTRKRSVTQKRHECMKKIRALGFSYPIIGKVFNCDHSTVMYGCGWRTKVK